MTNNDDGGRRVRFHSSLCVARSLFPFLADPRQPREEPEPSRTSGKVLFFFFSSLFPLSLSLSFSVSSCEKRILMQGNASPLLFIRSRSIQNTERFLSKSVPPGVFYGLPGSAQASLCCAWEKEQAGEGKGRKSRSCPQTCPRL